MSHYKTIEQAILYLTENYRDQPDLETVAQQVGLSPFHFQRLFQEWAGVSPKKFLQFLSLEESKKLLQAHRSILDTSLDVGLSSPSRLHDLFLTIESMTPGSFKAGGSQLVIDYHCYDTHFGQALIASTDKGICSLAFWPDTEAGLTDLRATFPFATFRNQTTAFHEQALTYLKQPQDHTAPLTLHLKGTPFQLKVWQALLQLPFGSVSSYGDIAESINHPNAVRAVASAVGDNHIAYLIPCHRVIRSSGVIGEYRWGPARKQAMLGWEASRRMT